MVFCYFYTRMKKYNSLSEFIIDYRTYKDLTQLDLSAMLDVDTRTISRWEKGDSRIHPDKEEEERHDPELSDVRPNAAPPGAAALVWRLCGVMYWVRRVRYLLSLSINTG